MDIFMILRPRASINDMRALFARKVRKLQVGLRHLPELTFKAQLLKLSADGLSLVNLSFGISAADAVSRFRLTASDFCATDQTVELLYLIEAKAAVMKEASHLIAKLEGAKKLAETHAVTDSLTGIGNRRAMHARLDELISAGVHFALLQIDLDYFKQVNDQFGHEAGDAILKQVGKVLSETIRQSDLAARIGGDEFVLLLGGLREASELQNIAARIIQRLEQPISVRGQSCHVSGSIGIARSSDYAAPEADQMLRDADEALYRSKREGRGRVNVVGAQAP